MSRELTGANWSVVCCEGESLSKVLIDAAMVLAKTEAETPTGFVYNERGAVRIVHNQDEEGQQVLVIFEGGSDA